MAMPCVLLITILGVEVTGKSSDSLHPRRKKSCGVCLGGYAVPRQTHMSRTQAVSDSISEPGLEAPRFCKEPELECCIDTMEGNATCLASSQCSPGCYKRWNEDGSSSCVKCENGTVTATPVYNLTDCRNNAGRGVNTETNLTTAAPVTVGVGGPEVAASLIFGTFVISLFLILCVASFFYLKRANKLPNLFYRRSKGSVVQSAESASMLSPPSSVRKPRYVRRERSLMSSGTATSVSAETRVSNV